MKPELSKLNKEEFKQEMKRREKEMKDSGRTNSIGLNRFGSAFFKKQAIHFIYAIFRLFLIIGLSYVVLYPVLRMVRAAFNEDYFSSATSIWIPEHIGLTNIKYAVNSFNYWESLVISVRLSIVAALLQVVSSAVIGYGFARFKFKGREILFALVILTMIIPPQTYLVSLFMTFRKFDFFKLLTIPSMIAGKDLSVNLIGTEWTMWIPAALGVGLRGGLLIYIFRQFFRGMSKELEEAAYIDGCGPFKTFLKIMVPNALSSALVVFLFSLVWHWNDYFTLSMMYSGTNKVKPLSIGLMNKWSELANSLLMSGAANVNLPYILASGALLFVIPIILVFSIAQKYFIESVDKVGIKG